jgi:hypothetical protein
MNGRARSGKWEAVNVQWGTNTSSWRLKWIVGGRNEWLCLQKHDGGLHHAVGDRNVRRGSERAARWWWEV